MQKTFIDITGQKFGDWTVLKRASNGKNRRTRWLCRCDCGKEQIITSSDLRAGKSKGCQSCHIKLIKTIHSKSSTFLHRFWRHIIERCENSNHKSYKYYGGRGIGMCFEWRNDFLAFYNWAIANGYGKGLTIERIDNNGNYKPSNCRFATRKEQARNRRDNKLIKIGNKIKPICEWAEQAGFKYNTLWKRIKKGWPEDKLLKPVEPVAT